MNGFFWFNHGLITLEGVCGLTCRGEQGGPHSKQLAACARPRAHENRPVHRAESRDRAKYWVGSAGSATFRLWSRIFGATNHRNGIEHMPRVGRDGGKWSSLCRWLLTILHTVRGWRTTWYFNQVATTLEPFTKAWVAEEDHQDYLVKNPNGYTCHFERFGSFL